MPTVTYTPEEFAQQQGYHIDDGIYDRKSNWLVFPNGARTDRHFTHLLPPEHPVELLQLKILYSELHFENYRNEYIRAENSFNQQCYAASYGAIGPPTDEQLEQLRAMRVELLSRKEKLEELKAQYVQEPSEADQAWNRQVEQREAQRQQAHQARQRLYTLKSEINI